MLSTWQVTEWHGGVERLGHVIAALKSCTHSYLLGTIILKPHFIPDTSSLLWKKQPSCEVSSSLKSKDPNQEFAKASNSQSFLQETNLSWPWCLKSLNPKLKWLASSLFCLPHLIFLKIERGRGKPWWIFFFFFCQPLVLFLWNISGFSLATGSLSNIGSQMAVETELWKHHGDWWRLCPWPDPGWAPVSLFSTRPEPWPWKVWTNTNSPYQLKATSLGWSRTLFSCLPEKAQAARRIPCVFQPMTEGTPTPSLCRRSGASLP